MEQDDARQPRFKIKSYYYFDDTQPRRIVFALEEYGVSGELRQFAEEIVQRPLWHAEFSAQDVAKILYVLQEEQDLG